MPGMRKTGENSRISSQHNRGLILRLIATGMCHSRIELARETELTKMTITNIVSEFRRNNIVVETEECPTDVRGRNPITVEIASDAPKILGILISTAYCEVVICDLQLHILKRKKTEWKEGLTEDTLIEDVCILTDSMLQTDNRFFGIGVASIGPLNINQGMILDPPDFYGIQNVQIAERLKERYAYPVFVDRDSNSSALAEALYGAGKMNHDFIYMSIDDRIGSGVITQGDLFRNSKGYAPEIGHVCIRPQGDNCFCGNQGCLQSYAGRGVILKKLREATGKDLSFKEFCELSFDETVDRILTKMMDDLLIALVSSINILHPEAVILGDDGVYIPAKYLKYLEKQINMHKFYQNRTDIKVKHAGFLADAKLVGAACNVVMEVFKGKVSFRVR